MNETVQSTTVALRKMADGAEIAREDDDTISEKPYVFLYKNIEHLFI